MAKIIEFYIPQSFRKVSKWLPPNERGKLLEFPMAVQKSARRGARKSHSEDVSCGPKAKSASLRLADAMARQESNSAACWYPSLHETP